MSCWNKEELENMLEDVVNELNLIDPSVKQLVCPRCESEFVRVDSNREMQVSEVYCSDCGLGFLAPVPEVVIEKMWRCIKKEDCPDDGYDEVAE